MSHHRWARHVFGVAVCIAVMVVTTGCRSSPYHPFGRDRPIGPDGKPVGFQEALSPLDQASAAPAPKPSAPSPVAVAAAATKRAASTSTSTPSPVLAPAPSDGPSIAPADTPLLDAALKRAQAIDAEQRLLMRAEAEPPAPVPAEMKVKTAALPAVVKKPDAKPPSDAAVKLASAEEPAGPTEVDRAKLWNACVELVDRLPADLSAAAVPAMLPRAVALLAPVTTTSEPAPPPRREPSAFGINAVELCRNIQGFGSFETMDAQTLKAGRQVLIYCELARLHYERQGDEFVSHVATRVELVDARDGVKAWEVLGEAEDRCHSLRRDSFVSTLVTLPETIVPGAYTIRLTQTDTLAQQSATAEMAVTIGR
ncbi:MAG: hypothetical protein P4L85_10330 [Paludisphaera borealis]|uniref:hypothetical protein n=1 Tax=Paludisphaera borealis TaxID=1387353 RepID=UPI0028431587|nr:hypothetical protein [Paludisphaera borealis]MDR3619735.1 hypothetical protein [Paludisphaera borealis]